MNNSIDPRLVESDENYEELLGFLQSGGNPNLVVYDSTSLLHLAAQSCEVNTKVVRKLITDGADIDLATSTGSTPLIFAVMSRNRSAVKLLIEAGAQINVVNSFGRTALHYAIDSCYPKHQQSPGVNARNLPDLHILKILVNHVDIDINPVNLKDETPLMWAVKRKDLFAVHALLEKGANPNMLNQKSRNSLHLALLPSTPNSAIVFELLQNGAEIYHKDNFGRTAMDFILQRINSNENDDSYWLTSQYLKEIVLKYHIKKDLVRKVARFPRLTAYLSSARREIEWMHEEIIYKKITLHDFAIGCFQPPADADTVDDIYILVVAKLLPGKYSLYLDYILQAIPRHDLCGMLRFLVTRFPRIVGQVSNPLLTNQTHLEIFQSIRGCYNRIRHYNLMILPNNSNRNVLR